MIVNKVMDQYELIIEQIATNKVEIKENFILESLYNHNITNNKDYQENKRNLINKKKHEIILKYIKFLENKW